MHPSQDPPEGWPKPHRSARKILSVAGFSLMTLIVTAVAAAAIINGDIVQAAVFTLGAVLFLHLVGLSVSTLRQPKPPATEPATGVTDDGEVGLAFPYARLPYYWLSVVLGVVLVLALGFAVAFVLTASTAGWVIGAIAASFAVFLAWFLFILLKLAPGRIVVTPTGVYHRSLVLEHFVPWQAVVEVHARQGPTPWITVKAMPSSTTRERRHTGPLGAFESQALPFLIARTYWLGANSVPAYRAIKFFFDHPEERPRLAHRQLVE